MGMRAVAVAILAASLLAACGGAYNCGGTDDCVTIRYYPKTGVCMQSVRSEWQVVACPWGGR